MKVLVTGSGGFIGSHLIYRQLAKGHEVRCVGLYTDRMVYLVDPFNLEIVTGGIKEAQAAESIMQADYKPQGCQSSFSECSLDFYLKNNAYHNEKARQERGCVPQFDLREGIELTLK